MIKNPTVALQEEHPPRRIHPKYRSSSEQVFSERFPLGSWLVSQGRRQKFARTFRKSSRRLRGFQKGGEGCKGGVIGVVRALVAKIDFAFFVRELIVESYINSEMFTAIWCKIISCNRCAHDPNYWDLPPHKDPLLATPEFTRPFSKSSRELLPSSLCHGVRNPMETVPDELFLGGWILWGWIFLLQHDHRIFIITNSIPANILM